MPNQKIRIGDGLYLTLPGYNWLWIRFLSLAVTSLRARIQNHEVLKHHQAGHVLSPSPLNHWGLPANVPFLRSMKGQFTVEPPLLQYTQ
jgi:hypothetical protein